MKQLFIFLIASIVMLSCSKSTDSLAKKEQTSIDEARRLAMKQAQADAPYNKCQDYTMITSSNDMYAVTDFNWSDSTATAFRADYLHFNQDSVVDEVREIIVLKNDLKTNVYRQICYPSLIP